MRGNYPSSYNVFDNRQLQLFNNRTHQCGVRSRISKHSIGVAYTLELPLSARS